MIALPFNEVPDVKHETYYNPCKSKNKRNVQPWR